MAILMRFRQLSPSDRLGWRGSWRFRFESFADYPYHTSGTLAAVAVPEIGNDGHGEMRGNGENDARYSMM
jgi:hypothetical protein